MESNNNKDRIFVAYYILSTALFVGLGGLHHLYNGKIGTGLLWFLSGSMFAAIAFQLHRPTYNQPTYNKLMMQLVKAAECKGGKLTVTQGVKATGASFTEVEAVLTEILKSGYARIDNDPVSGAVTYHFYELD